jgi:NAD(P)-dependent dehydrogenase (short-subunit alcohol dehydrogenase family)
MRTLRDRVAVVTGAASGIGRALAIELAREGCDLAVCDVDAPGLEETRAAIQALGRKVCTHRVDVSDKARMQRYAEEVVAFHGRVHIVINNAGVVAIDTFEKQSLEDFEWVIAVNFWGVVYGCKFFLPYLKQADEGHIVNISSVFGMSGIPLQTSYSASKFAVRGMTDALWVELRQQGIAVTAVYPGGVRTNIARSSRSSDPSGKAAAIDIVGGKSSLEPAECARRIIRGIQRNQGRILLTPETHIVDALERVAPSLSRRVTHWMYRRYQAGKW